MIDIYIPSRGRPHRQPMAEALTAAGIPFITVLSTNDPTAMDYPPGEQVLVKAANLSEKRQCILDLAKQKSNSHKLLMLDDDLTIYSRMKNGNFTKATPAKLRKMVKWFDKILDKHAHAGVVDKFMGQHAPRGVVRASRRYSGVLGYNVRKFPLFARFRLICNQEHDLHLQLAYHGRVPAINCEFSRDQKYYAAGGCTKTRTKKVEAASHRDLAKNFPDWVKVVPNKNSKTGIGVRFNWRRINEHLKKA